MSVKGLNEEFSSVQFLSLSEHVGLLEQVGYQSTRKLSTTDSVRMCSGKEFQITGTANEKLLRPILVVLVRKTTRSPRSADPTDPTW